MVIPDGVESWGLAVGRGTLKTRDIRIADRSIIARLGDGDYGGIEASVDACKLVAAP